MTAGTCWPDEVDGYLRALERGDRAAALDQVRSLGTAGHGVVTLIQELLVPAQLRVGELWASDAWSVAQEHAATAISETVLTALAVQQASASPGPVAPATASPAATPEAASLVVTCVEQEWHALPALMVSEHLRAEGFTVSYLGANSSAQGLVRHVHEVGPAAVLLSCSLSSFLPLLRRQLEAVRETGTPVVVGGAAFDSGGRRARVLGATAFAPSAAGIADLVRHLPSAVPPAPPLTHPGADEAYLVFGGRETLADEVGHLVRRALADDDSPTGPEGDAEWLGVLEDQLPHVVGAVAGALVSDDPSLVGDALGWAERVLASRGAPAGTGRALRSALRATLDQLPVASGMLPST